MPGWWYYKLILRHCWRHRERNGRLLDPEGEGSQGIEPVSLRIVLQEAAVVPPSTSSILPYLGWSPCPGPIRFDGRVSIRGEITDQLYVGVLVEIWI